MLGGAGLVAKFEFNSAGVAFCLNAILAEGLDTKKLPIHLAIRKALECSSFDEVVTMLNSRGVASAINLVVGDSEGTSARLSVHHLEMLLFHKIWNSLPYKSSIRPRYAKWTQCAPTASFKGPRGRLRDEEEPHSKTKKGKEFSEQGKVKWDGSIAVLAKYKKAFI
ncbi:Acyl-coenzyme A:6-aminopenicillanic-acid-acyltransferase 29 kDa subunit [Hyphodiscus hymeniophilus]|uniref:Acyl-coenzyme A:6-aminopenicillanic-acid-acyltransferase 29 kDa subunit n=1 Tax=Hyphodiscus hymeniophilus TaxID=353542 RepID=A0A9P6SKQ3_9HELO|nr:Acyl-coenzyme A:6-aminopenicillanic-acid-acyltransferase 29 kDa subunit [Hyphodiscus hymeniophilus]